MVLTDFMKARCLTLRTILQDVYSILGKGYPESVYQRAISVELQQHRIPFDLEVTMGIPYKEHTVGHIRADIILRDSVPIVIETKATATNLKMEERWQIVRYMKILNIPLGILVNFPQSQGQGQQAQMEFILYEDEKMYMLNIDTDALTEFS